MRRNRAWMEGTWHNPSIADLETERLDRLLEEAMKKASGTTTFEAFRQRYNQLGQELEEIRKNRPNTDF